MGDRASDRLEGWLDDSPIDELRPESVRFRSDVEDEPREVSGPEVWDDGWDETPSRRRREDEDPWV